MKLGTFTKQPNEKRRYGISYEDALGDGEVIINASASADPVGELTVTTEYLDNFVNLICVGGLDGTKYKVTVTVTTTATKEIFEDEVYVRVKEI